MFGWHLFQLPVGLCAAYADFQVQGKFMQKPAHLSSFLMPGCVLQHGRDENVPGAAKSACTFIRLNLLPV